MSFNSKYIGTQVEELLGKIPKTDTIWHSGNFKPSDYLPLIGGTISASGNPLSIKRTDGNGPGLVFYSKNKELGSIGISTDYVPKFYDANAKLLYTIWHAGNDGSGSGLDADLLDGKQPSELNVGSATKLVSGTTNTLTASGVTLKDTYGRKVYDVGSEWFAFGSTDVVGVFQGYDLNFKCGAVTTMVIKNTTGSVGIGIPNPGYKLDVNGDIHTSGTLTQDSDIRLKNINKNVLLSLEDISNAPLFEFTYKSDENKRIHVGTSAQYWVEKNNWFCKKQDNGYYDMEIQNLALASAISIAKEFKKYKEETESTISSMKKEIEELKQIILNMNK